MEWKSEQRPDQDAAYRTPAQAPDTSCMRGRRTRLSSGVGRSRKHSPNICVATCVVAASGALAGRRVEAENAGRRLRQLKPTFRISDLDDLIPLRRPVAFGRWADVLRKAGLQE